MERQIELCVDGVIGKVTINVCFIDEHSIKKFLTNTNLESLRNDKIVDQTIDFNTRASLREDAFVDLAQENEEESEL